MLKVYMLGSGPIAVPVLEKLHAQAQAGLLELVGVGTQPDRPAGRKRQLMPTPVGAFAEENGVPYIDYNIINMEEGMFKHENFRDDAHLNDSGVKILDAHFKVWLNDVLGQ